MKRPPARGRPARARYPKLSAAWALLLTLPSPLRADTTPPPAPKRGAQKTALPRPGESTPSSANPLPPVRKKAPPDPPHLDGMMVPFTRAPTVLHPHGPDEPCLIGECGKLAR